MKRLIVTADDFGYGPEINAAVARAYKDGILRYASLMVDRPGAAEAAAIARRNPGLGVGLHLELCAREPALWGLRYFFLPEERRRIEPEIERQIGKFLALGLKPTHVDGHFNIHVHPVIFPILARLARRHGIPRVRLPGGEGPVSRGFDSDAWLGRQALAGVFGALRAALRPAAGELAVADATWGLLRSGLMKEDYLAWLIERLPEGTTEIYLHPSADPATPVSRRPTATHHTVSELEALLSARVREALARSGASLEAEKGAPAWGD